MNDYSPFITHMSDDDDDEGFNSDDSADLSETERNERRRARNPEPLDDLIEMAEVDDVNPMASPSIQSGTEEWPIDGARWTAEETIEKLETLYTLWYPPDLDATDRAIHPLRVIKFDPTHLDADNYTTHQNECHLEWSYQKGVALCCSLELRRHRLLDETEESGLFNQQRIRKVLKAIYSAREILRNTFDYAAEFIPNFDSRTESALSVCQFTTVVDQVPSDSKEYAQLLLFLYREVYEQGYRRSGDLCFKRVYTRDGKYFTYAWEEAMSIAVFVRSATNKMLNYRQWLNRMAHKDNTQGAIRELTEGIDDEFPEVDMDRDVFAFENGIYVGRADRFHAYADGPALIVRDDGSRKEPVAAKYFPVIVPSQYLALDCSQWEQIETLAVDRILKFQRFDLEEDVIFWFFVFMGRWFFNIRQFDDWQVAPFLLGMAGSGKSTLLSMLQNAYPPNKVGTLSNNIEKQFGLSSLEGCFSWVAPEVKYDFQLGQAELQSIISGESVSVAVKHKTAHVCRHWLSPGWLSGNQVPKLSDNAGSTSRRLIVFQFNHLVTHQDGSLNRQLEAELPFIIIKAIKAYHYAVQTYGTRGIWECLPPYFHQTRGDLQETTNALVHFIRSDKLERGKGLYMPIKDFKDAFNRHCDENHFSKQRWVKEYYEGPFQMNDLRLQALRREYPRRPGEAQMMHCTFVVGCDIARSSVVANDGAAVFLPESQPQSEF